MNSKVKLLVFILLFAVLIAGAYLLYNNLAQGMSMSQLATQEQLNAPAETTVPPQTAQNEQSEQPRPEELAPDFTVYDAQGESVKLSDFVGKPVVLNFWSSHCGPCKMEMPDFQRAYEQLGEDIHFLMVNVTDGSWDTLESASDFIAQQGYTFPVYFDTDVNAVSVYGATALPTTYFIDAQGRGIAYGKGAMDFDTLMTGIDMIYTPAE